MFGPHTYAITGDLVISSELFLLSLTNSFSFPQVSQIVLWNEMLFLCFKRSELCNILPHSLLYSTTWHSPKSSWYIFKTAAGTLCFFFFELSSKSYSSCSLPPDNFLWNIFLSTDCSICQFFLFVISDTFLTATATSVVNTRLSKPGPDPVLLETYHPISSLKVWYHYTVTTWPTVIV